MSIILILCAFSAAAQGSAGNKNANNWKDKEFAPAIKNGATHLRFGNGGLMSGMLLNPRMGITRGNPSCDLTYLYFIKSGKKMPVVTREECAFNEYKLDKLWTYEALTALNNSFTKAKALQDYLPKVDSRMLELSQASQFYVRAPLRVVSINPSNMIGDLSFDITDQNWQVSGDGAAIMVSAKGSAIGIFEPRIQFSPTIAPLLEEARVLNLLDTSRGEVYYDLTSFIPANQFNPYHLLLINNVKY